MRFFCWADVFFVDIVVAESLLALRVQAVLMPCVAMSCRLLGCSVRVVRAGIDAATYGRAKAPWVLEAERLPLTGVQSKLPRICESKRRSGTQLLVSVSS